MTLSLETSGLHQKAVLWLIEGTDTYGQTKVGLPNEVSVRWEKGLVLSLLPTSAAEQVEATVYTDQVIPVGSIMWEGKLDDMPDPLVDLRKVEHVKQIPDIKNRYVRYVSLLTNYHDTPLEV